MNWKIKRICIAALLIWGAFFHLAAFPIFMPEDPEVDRLLTLYTRAGYQFPDASYPLSLADLDEFAARLLDLTAEKKGEEDEDLADRDQRKTRQAVLQLLIREYRADLGFESGRIVRGSRFSFRPAAFLNGDADIPEQGDVTAGEDPIAHVRFPNDFYTRFVEFPDMAQLALFAGVQGSSGMHISAGVKREFNQGTVPDLNLFIRTSNDPAKIENYLIRTGYLAWRSDHFEAWFGRAPVHYGDARFSTFLPSERLPWMDAFTYRYRLGPLTMTSYFGTLDNRMSEDEQVIFLDDGATIDSEGGPIGFIETDTSSTDRDQVLAIDPLGSPLATGYAFTETIILNSMHRFVLGWEKFRLGVTAAMVTARENNAIVIGDLFPVFSWHNGIVGHHNMHLVFETGYTPMPGLALYGQAAWDDINASDVFGIPDSSLPTIGAYLAGIVYQPELGGRETAGIFPSLTIRGEIGRTHYLWGNYYSYDPGRGSYFSRAIYRYKGQKGYYWMPLTSPYGPGTWWIESEAGLKLRPDLSFTAGCVFLRYNPDVNLFTTPYVRDDSLEDTDSSTSVSVYVETLYTYRLNERNEVRFRLVPVFYSRGGNTWPELEVSAELLRRKVTDF